MQRIATRLLKGITKSAIMLLMIVPVIAMAQPNATLTLQKAFELAEKNYPNFRQKELLKQTQSLNIQNLGSAYLPQVTVNAQASYQSDVTQISISLPGVNIPSQSKDQYKLTADVSQLIYDGGLVKEQKKLQQLATTLEDSKLNVELYNLKNRVFQLYFAILYQQELLEQTNFLLNDVQTGIAKIKPQVDNGVMLRSNLLVLQAQQLQTKQRTIEIKNSIKGLTDALSKLLNEPIDNNTLLAKTEMTAPVNTTISRPELLLYESQKNSFEAQKNLIQAKNLPKVSAFVQGGYGRPGLNFLSNEFDAFYITGLRANWNLSNLYNAKRDKKLLDINQRTIDLQKETFLLNTQTQLSQQQGEIDKYEELIASDKDIIDIRKKISDAAKAQLDNAVITSNDYLKEINAEDAARQTLIVHQLQYLQAKVNYSIIAGTF